MKTEKKEFQSIKVTKDVHERLKILAALERKTLHQVAEEALAQLTEPFKGIKYAKRTKQHDQNPS